MRKFTTRDWMSGAFLVGLAILIAVYAVADPSHRLGIALRATARWSFLLFCLSSYGGALTTLVGPAFLPLARRARELGLAYASAHLVHVALAIWLLYRSTEPFPRLPLTVFSVGVFCTYLLALISLNGSLSARLGARRWKTLRSTGVEYLAFAFAFEFGGRILDGNRANALYYSPLFVAAVAGPLLRLAAYFKRRAVADKTAGFLPG